MALNVRRHEKYGVLDHSQGTGHKSGRYWLLPETVRSWQCSQQFWREMADGRVGEVRKRGPRVVAGVISQAKERTAGRLNPPPIQRMPSHMNSHHTYPIEEK